MKKIKVKFVDMTFNENLINCFGEKQGNYNLILEALQKHYEVEISDTPDYVFTYIPVGNAKGYEYAKYRDSVLCLIDLESVFPDFDSFDYVIGGYHTLKYEQRYLYLPGSLLGTKLTIQMWDLMRIKHLDCNEELCKRDFCSFTVSNGINASSEREKFFWMLNDYKKVDSGGRLYNNTGGPVKDKLEFDSKHKFSITFENSWYSCISEKIDMGFAAKTIPIYWGNPKIGDKYNEKAFINCHSFNSFEEVINRIKEIDNDDDLYLSMLKEPALLMDKSKEDCFSELDEFLINMIETPIEKAIRRSNVYWSKVMQDIRISGFKKLYRRTKIIRIIFFICGKIFNPIKDSKLGLKIKKIILKMR